jgi:hypothetical protein
MNPDLRSYIEAAANSTSRARAILAVMVSAAFLLICAYANALVGYRAEQAGDLEAAIDYRDSLKAFVKPLDGLPVLPNRRGADVWDRLTKARPTASEAEIDTTLRTDARELRTYLLKDGTSVALPIVNVAIDVHDLWICASIGFTIIQIALIYAIAREAADVETTLTIARASSPQDWRAAYGLLAMRQLFTVPPGTWKMARPPLAFLGKNAESFWSSAPKSLLCLPVGAQVFGLIIGFHSASPRYWLEGLLVLLALLSVALTATAWRLENAFDKVWDSFTPPKDSQKGVFE